MNKVVLNFWGTLKKPNKLLGDSIEIKKNETIYELLLRLDYKETEIEYINIYVNEREVRSDYVLNNEDIVDFFIHAGGGWIRGDDWN